MQVPFENSLLRARLRGLLQLQQQMAELLRRQQELAEAIRGGGGQFPRQIGVPGGHEP